MIQYQISFKLSMSAQSIVSDNADKLGFSKVNFKYLCYLVGKFMEVETSSTSLLNKIKPNKNASENPTAKPLQTFNCGFFNNSSRNNRIEKCK